MLWNQPTCSLRLTLGILLLWILGLPRLQAQTLDTLAISSSDYSVLYDSSLLNKGDTALFEIHFGNQQSPITNLRGFQLWVSTTNKAILPSSKLASFQPSWLADDTNFTSSSQFDHATNTLALICNRTDQQSRSGYGQVVQFTFIASVDSTAPGELIVSNLGGQMIVENLDMKWDPQVPSPFQETTQIKVYPQPATSSLSWESGDQFPIQFRVMDLQGRVGQDWPVSRSPRGEFDTTGL